MKGKKSRLTALFFQAMIPSLFFSGCAFSYAFPDTAQKEVYTGEADVIADFSEGLGTAFYAADGWSNGGMFDCTWSRKNVVYDRSKEALTLTLEQRNNVCYAGEFRSVAYYSYGYYAVKMKAIPRSGVVSSFFTYTGPADGNPWDEIDVEILGKDATKVQFNYFTNGKGGHEYLYDLGFDASLDLHEYGFLWKEDCIVWFVDGVEAYTATEEIPSTPSRIMINAWPVKTGSTAVGWAGQFDGIFPVPCAEYKWISYKRAQ